MTERKKRKSGYTMLKERDLQILEFLAKFGYCNEEHLAVICGLNTDRLGIMNINRIVTRLEKSNFVVKNKLMANRPAYVLLGKSGAELLASVKPKQLILNTLKHDMLVIDLYLKMMKQYPDYEIQSERELRIKHGISLSDKTRVPDLLINSNIAVEIEISEKSAARLQQIVSNYIGKNSIQFVLYYVKNETLGQKIYEYSAESEKIKVFYFDKDDIATAKELPRKSEKDVQNGFDFSRF